ncbi:hypothetical protein LCGC14_2141750 [marine sediment metagenome]|uniref:Uncharacterized protein n=1 Tax=marine sediment metagenome TaxID=412755 RepID=A0A0F9GUI6_9ZZZZ
MNFNTIISWGVGIVLFGILGFIIFKLILIVNDQLSGIRRKMKIEKSKGKDNKEEDEVERLKKILDLKKQIKDVEGEK